MKKILIVLLLGIFLLSGFTVLADSKLPSAGMLPDNTFYFFKVWKESIQTFFTFKAEKKVNQYLHLADVRLAEYQKLIEKNKTELAQKTLDKYEKQLNRALAKASTLKNKDTALQAIATSNTRHREVLQENLAKAPEAAKKGLENAIAASSKVENQTENGTSTESEDGLNRKYIQDGFLAKLGVNETFDPGKIVKTAEFKIGTDQFCSSLTVKKDIEAGQLSTTIYDIVAKTDIQPKSTFPQKITAGNVIGCEPLDLSVGQYEYRIYTEDKLAISLPFAVI